MSTQKMCRRNRLSVCIYTTRLPLDYTSMIEIDANASRQTSPWFRTTQVEWCDMRMTGCDTGPEDGDFCDQRMAMRKIMNSFRCRCIPLFLGAFECRIEFNLSETIMMDATVAVPAYSHRVYRFRKTNSFTSTWLVPLCLCIAFPERPSAN